MIVPMIFTEAPKGILYRTDTLADGQIDGKLFAVCRSDEGIVCRMQGIGTIMVTWAEIARSLGEAAETDDEGWSPLKRTDTSFNTVTGEAQSPQETGADEVWGNNLYTVHVRRGSNAVHLSFHRHDRAAVRDWRHAQRIKNEIVGPEYEGVEVYPSEARLVDTSNQYHLWVLLDETGGPMDLGIGFHEGRQVLTPEELATKDSPGAVQRPFESA